MKNIHILPTSEQIKNVGDLVKDLYGDIHIFTKKNDGKEYVKTITKLNIYITSDEEIKEGDWIITPTNDIIQWAKVFQPKGKKIILTTDKYLIKNGIQEIDDDFLEWFVKNSSCKFVEVRKEKYSERFDNDKSPIGNPNTWGNRWLAIIPKEEPKKVLTEEDIFNQRDIDAVTDYINRET